MIGGYMGKMLEVDLSNGSAVGADLNMDDAKKFIGGKGLGLKMLWDGVPKGTDPLGPDNLLLVMTGPLTGTLAATSARFSVVTKSPKTGIFSDGHVGGHFGPKLKFAGFDGIRVRGKADKPVYLHITEDKCEIRDASDMWGKGVFEVDKALKERHPGASCGIIGPAGENLITFSCISFDRGHQAGRCGSGTVMGSKNLKAIVVEPGKKRPQYADTDGFKEVVADLNKRLPTHPGRIKIHVLGTLLIMWEGIDGGHLPIKNYSGKAFAGIMNLVPEKLWEKGIMKGYSTCFGCPIACTKISEIQIGEYKGQRHETPEYEAAVMLGCNCGIDSYEWVTYLHVLCNDLGLDIISAGNTAAFAMECREKGLIDHDIKFGDGESLTKFLKDLAHKEGIGELFHKGVREASKEIGKGSEQFAIHVKGLELPALDPRASYGMSLAFATADRGGCHQRVWTPRAELYGKLKRFSTEGRAEFIKPIQDERAACFSLDLCDFISYSGEELAKLLTSATGFEFSEEDYVHTGERIWNLARMFAVREGISRKDDVLPPRLMEEPITEGPAAGQFVSKEKLDSMLDEYYALRGWDSNGIPTKEKLVSLGLDL